MKDKILDYIQTKCREEEDIPHAIDLIFDEFNVSMKKNSTVPLIRIVKSLGFIVEEASFKKPNVSGLICYKSEQPDPPMIKQIIVNEMDSKGHQRFTIAHELGHYIYDCNRHEKENYYYLNTYDTNDSEDNISEKRANKFAANLLMPKTQFKNDYLTLSLMIKNKNLVIDMLSNQYQVTPTAIKKRIGELF